MKREQEAQFCQNFEKTGVCPKGDSCRFVHRTLDISRCLVFHHMFPDPDLFRGLLQDPSVLEVTPKQRQNVIDAFYLDVFLVMRQFGIVEDIVVCGNRADHLSGNVIVMFKEANAAAVAHAALNGQFYAGRRLIITFAPILRTSNSICRMGERDCSMGDKCTFVHPLEPSKHVMNECFPRSMKAYALPFRNMKQQRVWDTPSDLLQGQTRMRREEE